MSRQARNDAMGPMWVSRAILAVSSFVAVIGVYALVLPNTATECTKQRHGRPLEEPL